VLSPNYGSQNIKLSSCWQNFRTCSVTAENLLFIECRHLRID